MVREVRRSGVGKPSLGDHRHRSRRTAILFWSSPILGIAVIISIFIGCSVLFISGLIAVYGVGILGYTLLHKILRGHVSKPLRDGITDAACYRYWPLESFI